MSRRRDEPADRDGNVAVLLSTAFERSTPNARGFRDVTPEVVHDTIGSARIVDVREPHEYIGDLGHIPEALLVPLAEVEAASERWDRSAPIVLVCRSGSRSAIAAELLMKKGFRAVMNMSGGMLARHAAGLPVGP